MERTISLWQACAADLRANTSYITRAQLWLEAYRKTYNECSRKDLLFALRIILAVNSSEIRRYKAPAQNTSNPYPTSSVRNLRTPLTHRSVSPLSRPHPPPACTTHIRYLSSLGVDNVAGSRPLKLGAFVNVGCGAAAGVDALDEETHPLCPSATAYFEICCFCALEFQFAGVSLVMDG